MKFNVPRSSMVVALSSEYPLNWLQGKESEDLFQLVRRERELSQIKLDLPRCDTEIVYKLQYRQR